MRATSEITRELLFLENSKEVIVLAYDNASGLSRYIDNEDSKYGTGNEESAMVFDTKEEAVAFYNTKGYLCFPLKIRVPNF